jgi:hypothetical protein
MRADPHEHQTLERLKWRAALYGMYLVRIEGYAPDEAAKLVVERYPQVKPWLQKLIDGHAGAPLAASLPQWREEACL